ncbi:MULTISPECIES: hypothetical protein [Leptolyngbya]|uniref:hypothetical protein n=1 Tax=Leptolyngbya TaxID=47251 RepID=UPI0016820B39|nr:MULTISPECIES: hypothetical protein [unclassified Leptolyngbya]MBD1855856.1 hypothetical protein [Leptolyngbya sp. FACHB-1624]MBN8559648.1 hypothetical protein [Leptolyngbya sp. UWPOB_LEPTO1]
MNWKLVTLFILTAALPATALPPPEDLPEEVARTEIITEARSPIDNKRLTAAEYADLQAQLQQRPPENPRNQVSPGLRKTIGLLRLRKFIRTVFPFIPIR